MLVSVDIKQQDVERLLAALKTAESKYTSDNKWEAADHIHKLNAQLRKQIFTYERQPNG